MIKNIGDRISVVVGAFAGSQIPQFFQQYTQRLAGHVEALHGLIVQLRQMAATSHKTLDQYVQKFKTSSDSDAVQQADFMQYIVQRYTELESTLNKMLEGSLWLKPYYFLRDFQPSIVHSTLDSFEFGFNFTPEAIVYAVLGMFLFWFLYHGLVLGISRLFHKARA